MQAKHFFLLVTFLIGYTGCGKTSGLKLKDPLRTGTPLQLVNNPYVDDHISLSEDGTRAVFLSSRDFPQSQTILKFKAYRATSANDSTSADAATKIFEDDLGLEIAAKLSPNGQNVAVIIADHDASLGHHLYLTSFPGDTSPVEVSFPKNGFLSNLSFSSDSSLLALNWINMQDGGLAVYLVNLETVRLQGPGSLNSLKMLSTSGENELLPVLVGTANLGYHVFSILVNGSIVARSFTSFDAAQEPEQTTTIGTADFASPSTFIAAPNFVTYIAQSHSQNIDIQDIEAGATYASLPTAKILKGYDGSGTDLGFTQNLALDIRGAATTASAWPISLVATNAMACTTAGGIQYFTTIEQLASATSTPRTMYIYRLSSDNSIHFTSDPCSLTVEGAFFDVGIFNISMAGQSSYQSGTLGFTSQIGTDQEVITVNYSGEEWQAKNISNNSP